MEEQNKNTKLRFSYKAIVIILLFALVFFISWIQRLTGPEFAFSFLYLIPIINAAWLAGLRWGILISVVSVFSWLLADLSMINRFSNAYIPLVNECFRLMVFLFVVFMINRYKKNLENQQELAAMDPLTGVANRRAFFKLARTEIDRSRRYNHPFSVMVIDIDDFKQINDHLGHQVGDRLLIKVVEIIKKHLRVIDIVSRFGGDEFVILLVRTEGKSALLVTEKLKKQLLVNMQDNQWKVTFSIGLATYHSVPDTVEETIRAADELMYQVKHSGKNSIRHAVLSG